MSFGFTEIILIARFILIVFGARRIPEMDRAMGRASHEFKKEERISESGKSGADDRDSDRRGHSDSAGHRQSGHACRSHLAVV